MACSSKSLSNYIIVSATTNKIPCHILGIHAEFLPQADSPSSKQNKAQALKFALSMKPVLNKLHMKGITSVRRITAELNRLNIPTYDKKKWHATTVHNMLKRIKDNETDNT